MEGEQERNLRQQLIFVMGVVFQAFVFFIAINCLMPTRVFPETMATRPVEKIVFIAPHIDQVIGTEGVFKEKPEPPKVQPPKKNKPPVKNNTEVKKDPPQFISDAVFRGNPGAGKKVALTFDDGPYPIRTAEYLKVLSDYGAKATFFILGQRAQHYPYLAQKIAASGNELGSHSFRHGRLIKMTDEQLDNDFKAAADSIKQVTGLELGLFRPPYGEYNESVVVKAESLGMKVVNWNVDPRDWETDDGALIAQRVLTRVRDGSVVVLHEGRAGTLSALPVIIDGLQKKGYQLVTISELMGIVHKSV